MMNYLLDKYDLNKEAFFECNNDDTVDIDEETNFVGPIHNLNHFL